MKNTTKVFEIKKGRKWFQVRATSITAANQYCKDNGYSDWRMVGMMSRAELAASQTLKIVA